MIRYLLSAIIFLPLLSAGVVLALPQKEKALHRSVAAAGAFITFILTCLLIFHFDRGVNSIQFVEKYDWISSLRIFYLIGVDGISLGMIGLTSLIFLLCTIASWDQQTGTKGYFSLFLMLETTVLGTFAAQDLFLFFAFWAASLLPAYSLISVWGSRNREYAATKFFLYQLAGCAFLMLGMFAIYYSAEPHQFSLVELAGGKFTGTKIQIAGSTFEFESVIFILMLIGFAVRIPVVPLHTWFPHVQAESPAALAVVLASVFIKTGAYALVRVNYALFPQAAQWIAPLLAGAGTVNIIYGATCAFAQRDIRRLVAYSCISHMGFIMLGLGIFSSTAFHGAFLQMFSHGIYAGLLFFLVGILGERSGHYSIVYEDGSQGFGGLVGRAPILTGVFTVAVFSAIGIPGFGAFVSQSLVFLGTFPYHEVFTIIGLAGVFLTCGYFLWMYRRVFLGQGSDKSDKVTDLTLREKLFLGPLILLTFLAGIYPTPLLKFAQPTVERVLSTLEVKK